MEELPGQPLPPKRARRIQLKLWIAAKAKCGLGWKYGILGSYRHNASSRTPADFSMDLPRYSLRKTGHQEETGVEEGDGQIMCVDSLPCRRWSHHSSPRVWAVTSQWRKLGMIKVTVTNNSWGHHGSLIWHWEGHSTSVVLTYKSIISV